MSNSISTKKKQKSAASAPPPMSLEKYQGPWTKREAGHLLKRCLFGPNQAQIEQAVARGFEGVIEDLFNNATPHDPPIRYTLSEPDPEVDFLPVFDDPNVPYGETWVNESPIIDTGDPQMDTQIRNYRTNSVLAWVYLNMIEDKISILPKMWLFWHNHFVVSDFRIPLQYYQYSALLEEHALGDFKAFTKAITVDASMLLYLNGNENVKNAPNENYARELLELFTIGKGDLAGPGDYTTFTETDVIEMARVLTGWKIDLTVIQDRIATVFRPNQHDTGTKTLSARFGNATITDGGEDEYSQLIDIIFEQEEVSKFICRKLYRYFVNYEINQEIEEKVIEPMAQILRDNDYNVTPAIKALISSEHFYGEEVFGCMIKNPADFMMSATRGLNYASDAEPVVAHFFVLIYSILARELDMSIFFHTDVAGWKAYYQEPQFYRIWINSNLLPKRNSYAQAFVAGGTIGVNGGNANIRPFLNVIDYISTIPEALDPYELIKGINKHLFTYELSEAQVEYLRQILIPGLPAASWTMEYSEFLANPFDVALQTGINNKLKDLFSAMLEMPEFQLM